MSQIEGRISVDVQFTDSTNATGVQSMKKLSLASAMDYTAGKVAIVTGTCSTTTANIEVGPTTYSNASCSAVTFSGRRRLAFAASPAAYVMDADGPTLYSESDQVAVTMTEPSDESLTVFTTAGTAVWTLVVWGDS